MNKTLQEEDSVAENDYEKLSSVLSAGKKILDIDICEMIDRQIDFPDSGRSFLNLTKNEITQIREYLTRRGVGKEQIDRCLKGTLSDSRRK